MMKQRTFWSPSAKKLDDFVNSYLEEIEREGTQDIFDIQNSSSSCTNKYPYAGNNVTVTYTCTIITIPKK